MPHNNGLNVVRNAVALSAANISVPVFSFVFVLFAARYLGVSGFGKYVLVMTLLQMFSALSTNGLVSICTREIARKPALVNHYVSSSAVLALSLTAVSIGILLMAATFLDYAPDTELALFIGCFALIPTAAISIFKAPLVAFERAEYHTYSTLLENLIRLTISFVVLLMGFGLCALFIVILCTRTIALIANLVLCHVFVVKLRWEFQLDGLRKLVRRWVVFASENWVWTVFHRLDVIFISFFHGEVAVGIYGAAFKVLNPAGAFASGFTVGIFPYLSRLFEESKETFTRVNQAIVKYSAACVLPCILAVFVFADRIIVFLYSEAYVSSAAVLRVLIWLLFPMFLNSILGYSLFAQGLQGKALKIAVLALVFYALIGWILIPRFDCFGAAWAVLISSTLATLSYFLAAFRGADIVIAVSNLMRILPGLFGVWLFLFLFKDLYLIPLITLATVFYLIVLLVMRLPTAGEIEVARRSAARGWRRTRRIFEKA